MKRVDNIFDKMCEISTLKQAIINASFGKKKYSHVSKVLKNIDFYAKKLSEILKNDAFVPSEYKTQIIRTELKERMVKKLPFFPDRCIQHAIAIVMLPKWDKVIGNDTFASWKGRGINASETKYNINHRLKKYICSHKLSNKLYCLKFDIKKCYQSIDNNILDNINAKYCKDERVLNLMKKINHGDLESGLAIGNYISQLWVNIYLTELDNFVKHELHCKEYVRYMDDCAILSEDKSFLHECKHRIMNFLWYTLKLELNNKTQIFPISDHRGGRSLDLCGYCFYRNFTLIRKRIKQHIKNKLDSPKSMASYKGLLMNCDSINLVKSLGYDNVQSIKCEEDKPSI